MSMKALEQKKLDTVVRILSRVDSAYLPASGLYLDVAQSLTRLTLQSLEQFETLVLMSRNLNLTVTQLDSNEIESIRKHLNTPRH